MFIIIVIIILLFILRKVLFKEKKINNKAIMNKYVVKNKNYSQINIDNNNFFNEIFNYKRIFHSRYY